MGRERGRGQVGKREGGGLARVLPPPVGSYGVSVYTPPPSVPSNWLHITSSDAVLSPGSCVREALVGRQDPAVTTVWVCL
mmetsp:Transcript_31871/g.87270  ORF Transcript_31871/g.87270 Transcript_31871/m.87270 type:complete len:80 (+) Transcript_31871:1702-1941(+)